MPFREVPILWSKVKILNKNIREHERLLLGNIERDIYIYHGVEQQALRVWNTNNLSTSSRATDVIVNIHVWIKILDDKTILHDRSVYT